MFIEKFLFKISELKHNHLNKIELSGVNLEQIEAVLTQYLMSKTQLTELRIDALNTPHSSQHRVEATVKENTAFD